MSSSADTDGRTRADGVEYDGAMNPTDEQLATLNDLARKNAGEPVGFINISDAQALTELGLASRSQQGWDITEEGAALLAGSSVGDTDAEAGEHRVLEWRPRSVPKQEP